LFGELRIIHFIVGVLHWGEKQTTKEKAIQDPNNKDQQSRHIKTFKLAMIIRGIGKYNKLYCTKILHE